MNVVFLLCAFLLAILSIPLYMGKLSNMIAGYNTMSEKEKEKYHELKLCRTIALTLDITAFVLILGAAHILHFNDTAIMGCVVLITGCTLSNFISKKDKTR